METLITNKTEPQKTESIETVVKADFNKVKYRFKTILWTLFLGIITTIGTYYGNNIITKINSNKNIADSTKVSTAYVYQYAEHTNERLNTLDSEFNMERKRHHEKLIDFDSNTAIKFGTSVDTIVELVSAPNKLKKEMLKPKVIVIRKNK